MKLRNIAWTDEDNKRLIEAVEAGITPARASVIFKRSMAAVNNQARRLGVRFPTINERKRELRSKLDGSRKHTASSVAD